MQAVDGARTTRLQKLQGGDAAPAAAPAIGGSAAGSSGGPVGAMSAFSLTSGSPGSHESPPDSRGEPTGSPLATVSLVPHVGVQVIPPVNFGMVEEALYRCGAPSELNYPFLEQLHLKKVIYLAPDDPTETFRTFVQVRFPPLFLRFQ